jgi:ribosome-associated toxin RatA of RatAB toxin-antitoxin module
MTRLLLCVVLFGCSSPLVPYSPEQVTDAVTECESYGLAVYWIRNGYLGKITDHQCVPKDVQK